MSHSATSASNMVDLDAPLPSLKDAGPSVAFGRAMRETHFAFAPTNIPINHGSFGVTPKAVLKVHREALDRSESRPDAFVHYELPRGQDEAQGRIAELLGTVKSNVVLVPNASTGLDTVLRGLRYVEGDVILYLEGEYSALEKAILYLAETTPVRAVKLDVHWPIADDALVDAFTQELARINALPGQRVKLAVFDTVMSTPGLRLPWERLVAATKGAGALSLIDGAHGIGHVDLRHLASVDPDFFASNLHKWLYVPRPCAALYVPARNQARIRTTLPTSHGFQPDAAMFPESRLLVNPLSLGDAAASGIARTPFTELFGFVATNDYSPQLCVGAALDWRAAHGGEAAIMAHCAAVGQASADAAAAILGTDVMDCPGSSGRRETPMANVRLPIDASNVPDEHRLHVGLYIKKASAREKDAYVQAFYYRHNYYWRVSGQIYVEEEEFVDVAKYLVGLCQRVNDGRWLKEGK